MSEPVFEQGNDASFPFVPADVSPYFEKAGDYFMSETEFLNACTELAVNPRSKKRTQTVGACATKLTATFRLVAEELAVSREDASEAAELLAHLIADADTSRNILFHYLTGDRTFEDGRISHEEAEGIEEELQLFERMRLCMADVAMEHYRDGIGYDTKRFVESFTKMTGA